MAAVKAKAAAKAAPAAKAKAGPLTNAKGGTWTGPKGGREGFLKGAKPEVQERYRAGRQVARSGEIAAGGGARPKAKAKATTAAKRPTTLPTGSGAKTLATAPAVPESATGDAPRQFLPRDRESYGGKNPNASMDLSRIRPSEPKPPPTVDQSTLEAFRRRFTGENKVSPQERINAAYAAQQAAAARMTRRG